MVSPEYSPYKANAGEYRYTHKTIHIFILYIFIDMYLYILCVVLRSAAFTYQIPTTELLRMSRVP